MRNVYGTFIRQVGVDRGSFEPIERTYGIIGVTQVSGCVGKQIETDSLAGYQTFSELPEDVKWSKDFEDLGIKNITDLDFEIRNKENREKYPKYRRAIISFENKISFVGLIDSETTNLINNGLKMVEVVNGKNKYYVNADKILTLEFLDKKGEN